MKKNTAKDPKKSLKQQFEEYKTATKQYLNAVFNTHRELIADIPAAKELKTANGLISEQPSGIMVVELLTMAKMAAASGNRVYIEEGPFGKSLRVYMVSKLPAPPMNLIV